MCLYSKELDTVSHLLWFFLYSFLALVFVKSFLPIWLADRCRCAFLMATCIKAKGRGDFFPTLYATEVLHNDGFEGWLTCCDLTKWWMSSHWQGGDLKYHLFFLWPLPATLNFTASHSTVVFFLLTLSFSFLKLVPYSELSLHRFGTTLGVQ